MNRKLIFILVLLCVEALGIPSVLAKNINNPQFLTIKFNEVNARTGPEHDCPIEWVFIKKGEPVEVVAHYDQWRKIMDIKGEGGWVHISSLSQKKSVIIITKNSIPLLRSVEKYDQIIAKLSPDLRCSLNKCVDNWCQITCKSYKGWINKKFLWGV